MFCYIQVRIQIQQSKDFKLMSSQSVKDCVCPGRTATVRFRIKPRTLGRINIRVSAETVTENLCAATDKFSGDLGFSDSLVKKLLVEAEGTKDEYTQSSFFCPSNGTYLTSLELALPTNVVPGSLFGRVEVIGDVMGSSLSNVDELLAMPYGCGKLLLFIINYVCIFSRW